MSTTTAKIAARGCNATGITDDEIEPEERGDELVSDHEAAYPDQVDDEEPDLAPVLNFSGNKADF